MRRLELAGWVPKTGAEKLAWAMIQRAWDKANRLGVLAAKEVTDRVEGAVSGTLKHTGQDGGPVRVRLEFTPRGAKTTVEALELPPGNGHDLEGEPEPLMSYPVGPEEEEG